MLSSQIISIFVICFLTFFSWSYDTNRKFLAHEVPQELQGIKVDEKTGGFVDPQLEFVDENGKKIKIGDYFQKDQPILLTIIYYMCPNLCQLHLNGLIEGIHQLSIGKDFQFVTVSMDPREKPDLARSKKQSYVDHFKIKTPHQWHFLTGNQKNIKEISQQVGFKFRWNEKEKQFAHLPVAYVLTPQGQISRYLYGVEMSPKTLKLSLVEAAQNRIGGVVDRILLFCFQFDPRKNRYTLYAYNIMRAGSAMMVLILALLLTPYWWRSRKK